MLQNRWTVPTLIEKGFSPGESRVVELLLLGLSNKQIGEKLCIQEKSVKFQCTNIYKKAQVKSRSELISQFLGATEEVPDLVEIPKRFSKSLPVGVANPNVPLE